MANSDGGLLSRLAKGTNSIRDWRCRYHLGLPCQSPVSYFGDFESTQKARLLRTAHSRASSNPSHLPLDIQKLEGMSGQRYRAFINGLMSDLGEARYLEVGSWKGSTVCAALHGNNATAVCIDNWSQFGGPRDAFLSNIESIRDRVQVIEADYRSVNYSGMGPFDIYLFDGPHEESDHYDGIVSVSAALAKTHILIVDDWNWYAVRIGTMRALIKAKCKLEAAIEIRTTLDNSHPEIAYQNSDWHNGYLLAVVTKTDERPNS